MGGGVIPLVIPFVYFLFIYLLIYFNYLLAILHFYHAGLPLVVLKNRGGRPQEENQATLLNFHGSSYIFESPARVYSARRSLG